MKERERKKETESERENARDRERETERDRETKTESQRQRGENDRCLRLPELGIDYSICAHLTGATRMVDRHRVTADETFPVGVAVVL